MPPVDIHLISAADSGVVIKVCVLLLLLLLLLALLLVVVLLLVQHHHPQPQGYRLSSVCCSPLR